MAPTTDRDAVQFLTDQHGQIRRLFQSVGSATGEERRDDWEALVRLLAVHETAEEEVVYPAIRKEDERIGQAVEARMAEEDQAKKMLVDLERLELGSPEFDELFGRVRAAVEAHAAAEEREIFPALARTKDAAELERMRSALELAERMAPTHPHKLAPESAVGNMLVGPFAAMFDRARDAMRSIGR